MNDLDNDRYVMPARITLDECVRDTWLPMMQTRVKPTTFRAHRRTMCKRSVPGASGERWEWVAAAMGDE